MPIVRISQLSDAFLDRSDFHCVRELPDNFNRHFFIHKEFQAYLENMPSLYEHRRWVEQNLFGFGERSFGYMWWLLVKEMPREFTFMEIGVYKGQILSLIELIAVLQHKKVTRYGITPLNNARMESQGESDFEKDIEHIHDKFGLTKDYRLLKGYSTDPAIIAEAQSIKVDLLYIDGEHTVDGVTSDLENYSPLVSKGGYIINDDACCDMNMPEGMFKGINECTEATLKFFTDNPAFKFVGNVVHNRIYQKV